MWYLTFLEKLHEGSDSEGGGDSGGRGGVGIAAASGGGTKSSMAVVKDSSEGKNKNQGKGKDGGWSDSSGRDDEDWLDDLKACVKQASSCLSRIRKYDPWKVFIAPPLPPRTLKYINPAYQPYIPTLRIKPIF